MTLEIIIFIGAVLFGIFIYQKESKANGLYRSINKLFHSKEVRMDADNRKGFIHKQDFLMRLVYIGLFFLVFLMLSLLLIPFSILNVQLYSACVIGTLVGTYIGSSFLSTKELVADSAHSVEDVLEGTFEKGKDLFKDIKDKVTTKETTEKIEEKAKKEIDPDEKSARERLKDKGLL